MLVGLRRKLPDQVHFMLAIRFAIGIKDVVEPNRWLHKHIRPLPGIPRQIRLRLAIHQPPVDDANVILQRDRQIGVEQTVGASCHVLGAENWPVIGFELHDVLLEIFRKAVIMEGQNIGLRQLDLFDRLQF